LDLLVGLSGDKAAFVAPYVQAKTFAHPDADQWLKVAANDVPRADFVGAESGHDLPVATGRFEVG
jgi:hypothetical protein